MPGTFYQALPSSGAHHLHSFLPQQHSSRRPYLSSTLRLHSKLRPACTFFNWAHNSMIMAPPTKHTKTHAAASSRHSRHAQQRPLHVRGRSVCTPTGHTTPSQHLLGAVHIQETAPLGAVHTCRHMQQACLTITYTVHAVAAFASQGSWRLHLKPCGLCQQAVPHTCLHQQRAPLDFRPCLVLFQALGGLPLESGVALLALYRAVKLHTWRCSG